MRQPLASQCAYALEPSAGLGWRPCITVRGSALVLLARTAQLRARTAALNPPTPFSQDDHTALNDQLRQHQLDLVDFRRRCFDAGHRPGV